MASCTMGQGTAYLFVPFRCSSSFRPSRYLLFELYQCRIELLHLSFRRRDGGAREQTPKAEAHGLRIRHRMRRWDPARLTLSENDVQLGYSYWH